MLYIENYKGFGNSNKFYLKGRLLSDPIIIPSMTRSKFLPLINNIRRFFSREKKHYPLNILINGKEHLVSTDDEGYYTLEISHELENSKSLIYVEIYGKNIEKSKQKIILSNPLADCGIISDIDDTILHTQVTSFWRMLYYSLFKTPWQREAIENASSWFNKMSKGGKNPFFYISHSPWNIYQNIITFLDLGDFPEGPVLLRDYGFHILEKPEEYAEHKKIFITKILDMHPKLPFILIGDAAEKDAHIYYEFLLKSPEKIKNIYIRKNKSMPQDLSYYENHQKFTVIEDFEEVLNLEKK